MSAAAHRTVIALVAAALAAGAASRYASAQQLRTYTQSEVGPTFLTYGLPVPLPIESLTPVDGFRSYASVQARLQALAMESTDLAAHEVGRTTANRTVWAYVASDEDGVDVEGRPEAAFFVNASSHAREWAAPEVSTGTLERLMAGAGDGGIVRYLLDNTRVVMVPVHNIDGVLQTQRYPTQVLIGQDPDFPADWPRDGRMRRKNMRGVDEVLTTTGDHLLGIDLNRNYSPFWATTPERSSANVNSLVYHGSGPFSEPENQAVRAAAALGPESRIRLGIDLHTFSRVFFSSNTGRTRLNTIQRNLIARMINHHAAVAGAAYVDIPDPANRGIGAAAEYFSYQWLVPGWTLELEPGDGGATEYGGLDVTHGGFILPASQARRVREGWAETHLVAFYQMSGPPHLARVRYVDVQSGALARADGWRYDGVTARRARVAEVPGTLVPGRRYRVELAFNKPMRWRDAQGNVAALPGTLLAPAPVDVALLRGGARNVLDTSGGVWLTDPARTRRYRDDTFAFEFTAPADLGEYALEVGTSDFTAMNLDADPSTPADWADGAWSEYENVLGIDGDVGGADATTRFTLAAAPIAQVSVVTQGTLAGEGDRVAVRLARGAGAGTLQLRRADLPSNDIVAEWAPGSAAERDVFLRVPDNAARDGERTQRLALQEVVDGVPGATLGIDVRVLDNDDAERVVWRAGDNGALLRGFNALAALPRGELVLDNADYVASFDLRPVDGPGFELVTGNLLLHGNQARVRGVDARPGNALFATQPNGTLELDALRVTAEADVENATANEAIVSNAGTLRTRRSSFASAQPLNRAWFRNSGVLDLERSGVTARRRDGGALLVNAGGSTTLRASSVVTVDGATPSSGALIEIAGGSALGIDASLSGYPIVAPSPAMPLRVRGSFVQEIVPGSAAFDRPNCTGPTLSSIEYTLFTAAYDGGDALDWRDGGCLALDANSRFMTGLALRQPLTATPPLLAFEAHPARDFLPGPGCGAVDQRGAPRPQTTTGGIVPPRCDAGAFEAGIDPQRGIWSPQRAGHGLDLQTAGNRLFLAWYTYEADGQPTAYQASAPFSAPRWQATLQQPRRNPQTGAITLRDVGNISLDFHDDTHATLAWRFEGSVQAQEEITASRFASGEPRVQVTGLWYPPADSGYGATITRQGESTAIGVYYYDAQGSVRWALGTGSGADAQDIAMTSFRGFCPDCATVPVTGTPAGTLRAHFHTPREARLDMQLTYPGAAGGPWNRSGVRFVPLGDPAD